MKKKLGNIIGVMTSPIGDAGLTPLSNLMKILSEIYPEIVLLTANSGFTRFKAQHKYVVHGFYHKSGNNIISRLLNYLISQLKLTILLIKSQPDTKMWLFFIGGDLLILPIITAKLLKKDVVIMLAGDASPSSNQFRSNFYRFRKLITKITYRLADHIILYSPRLMIEYDLSKYKEKIIYARHHNIDTTKFYSTKSVAEREKIVGYVGRFSREKGILNLLEAISQIDDELKFLIIGGGKLDDEVKHKVISGQMSDHVELIDWVPNEILPDYLNEMKLLVLPSFTEGLPNIMLEAMACGTPVLATPVGAIPDIIVDDFTGFLMENNSPRCIAENIVRALNSSRLEQIADCGRQFIEGNFKFESVVTQWKKMVDEMNHGAE